MKKRVLLVIMAALMLLTIMACGKKGIEGKWKLVGSGGDTFGDFSDMGMEGAEFFLVLKGGKMTFEFNLDKVDMTDEERQTAEAMMGMLNMATITYEVKSETEMEMSYSFMGESDTQTVEYTLNGDTLEIDGTAFQRQ